MKQAFPYWYLPTLLLIIAPCFSLLILNGCGHAENSFDYRSYGETDFYYRYFYPKQQSLELDELQNGFDSLQLRIWWHFSFSDSAEVFVIKKESGHKWSFSRTIFPLYTDSASFEKRTVTNDRGEETYKKLDSLGIKEYRGMDSLTHRTYTDGEVAIVEIATKTSYRRCAAPASLSYATGTEAEEVKTITAYLEILFSNIEFSKKPALQKK